MSKVVRVKIVQTGAVKTMTDTVAERLAKAMPTEYIILENPIIEAVKLPPVQKKSAEVVADSLNIGNPPPSAQVAQQVPTTLTTEEVITPKRGRPFKNQA